MNITANHITYARIGAVPLIAMLVSVDGKVAATLGFILFVLAAISDWYDGYLARKTDSTSTFGQVFDSIADKLLIGGCILALAYNGRFGNGLILPALIIFLREIFVAGLREFVFRMKSEDMIEDTEIDRPPLGATDLAKIKTIVQMVAVGILIISPYLFYPYFGMLGGLCFWAAAGLSLFTGWQYWLEARPTFIKVGMSK
jgi:cardiolipin synthase (CMP-forming)